MPIDSSLRSKEDKMAASAQIGKAMHERKLSDIDFTTNSTQSQVATIWGPPDDYTGSGNAYLVYRIGNQEVWMQFEPVPPHRLANVRIMPPSDQIAHVVGERKLSDIKFTANLTYQQVVAIWGRPDTFGGSGINYFVYQLNDGEQVWMQFLPKPPYCLNAAILVSPRTGQHKTIFEDNVPK
jgi:hypothetical protein